MPGAVAARRRAPLSCVRPPAEERRAAGRQGSHSRPGGPPTWALTTRGLLWAVYNSAEFVLTARRLGSQAKRLSS